jgi:hypothetical protein
MQDQTSAANRFRTAEESIIKFHDRILCAPDSELKYFSPYACTDSIRSCSNDDSSFEDEDVRPPPTPYRPRSSSGICKDVVKLGVISTLSRPRSESPMRNGVQKGRGMQRITSLPNINYGRASYNRLIGQTLLLECVAESEKPKCKEDSKKEVDHFDDLLENLW